MTDAGDRAARQRGRMQAPLRILLVDDDPNDRKLLAQTLRGAFAALDLTEATDAAGLARAWEEAPPDLLLTDYALGWTSGLAVLLRAKTRWPDVPVVMVTGTGSEEIAVECMKEGLDDYILKSPRHIVRLPAAIESALARAGERRALREAETRYRSLFAGIPVGLYRADPSGTVLDANPALASLLGLPDPAACVGVRLPDLCAEPDGIRRWQAWVADGAAGWDGELRMRREGGEILWVEHHGRAARDADGRALFLDGILEDITPRKRAEAALRRQHEELRRMAGRLSEVEETERRRLARELHDQVGQNLTAIGINANVVRAQLARDADSAVTARLDDLSALVQETAARIRSVMAVLRPPVLDDFGLVAALRWYADQVGLRTGLAVETAGEECTPRLPAGTENALFRIAQEALTNVAKHARASTVRLAFEACGPRARLTIADDGVGFGPLPTSDASAAPAGWGLRIMKERADAVGGAFEVVSRPGAGARIVVEVPR
jgi:two-component system sensor histidine kinase UhpB